ncbi:MAG: hypothetical protein OH338_02875 [Candidatus Parvarchaeota archaeon]|nr:hypothetical protein [Candidatus Parvarchaeota archaeon]MCW1294903.1 hypothetical protein [Candidatus Parvarchaeum tengchongense]MCW1295842.1 hypothetical protein [Candidatus Parvarchaeum tengchongense]MCW1298993.1 hypothetical protein [Candidatus Parvarchaeum tengchongense]MCW1312347.1 hypothetical protein [Candidatus Parvarchaeum tengchongense]
MLTTASANKHEKARPNKDIAAEPGKEFVFRLKDGKEVGRAGTLNGFEGLIRTLPIESLEFHNSGKHFSAWLRYLKQDRMANAFDRIDSKGERLRQELLEAIKLNRL